MLNTLPAAETFPVVLRNTRAPSAAWLSRFQIALQAIIVLNREPESGNLMQYYAMK